MVEHLPGIDKALGLVPSTIQTKVKRKPSESNSSPGNQDYAPVLKRTDLKPQFHLQVFELNKAAHTEILRIGRQTSLRSCWSAFHYPIRSSI